MVTTPRSENAIAAYRVTGYVGVGGYDSKAYDDRTIKEGRRLVVHTRCPCGANVSQAQSDRWKGAMRTAHRGNCLFFLG